MSMKVTVVEEKMKDLLKTAIYNKLQALSGTITHTNTDGLYSPARWWYDRYDTSLGGHILNTSGSMQVTDTGDNTLKVTVNLDYTLQDR